MKSIFNVALSMFVAFVAQEATALELTFHLVPKAHWNGGNPRPASYLPAGEVFLFRQGEYRPSLVFPANTPQEVPPGVWYWILEAPGFVSTESGFAHLINSSRETNHTIVWPVVPACTIELGTRERWLGLSRVDVVSLGTHATFPVSPRDRLRLQVPAGAFLAYTVNARGISAFVPPRSCAAQEVVELLRPEPPPPHLWHVVVTAALPGEQRRAGPVAAPRDLVAMIQPTDPAPASNSRHASASVFAARQGTFFFIDVSSETAQKLQIRHPELLSFERELSSRGGGVLELRAELQPRASAHLTVDYRPAREHSRAELALSHCGRRPVAFFEELDTSSCVPVEPRLPLRPGPVQYRVPDLDLGWYVVEAFVDDERIPGLGQSASLHVTAATDAEVAAGDFVLAEQHVFGYLLEKGGPVAGEVQLEPSSPGRERLLRFPTDDEGLYHLYFFAQTPSRFGRGRLPEKYKDLPDDEVAGLFDGYWLRACTVEGFCRLFHHQSTWSGSGRMDLELGAERELVVEVVDRATGKPVPQAMVGVGQRGRKNATFHVVGGQSEWRASASAEASATYTNSEGRVFIRDLAAGENTVGVSAAGYEKQVRTVTMPAEARLELAIALRAEDLGESDGSRLRLTDGRPASRAFLLGLTPEGVTDYRCSDGADGQGMVELEPSCLEKPARPFFVLHPELPLVEIAARDLVAGREVDLDQRSGRPLRVRLSSPDGALWANTPVAFRFGSTILGPDHFLAGVSFTGLVVPFRTDAAGDLELLLADPAKPLPDVALALGDGGLRWVDIPTASAEDVIELQID